MKYHKNNITLQIRVPVALAISILGRLYGCGIISRQQYMEKLDSVSHQAAEMERNKNKRLARLLDNASEKGAFFTHKKVCDSKKCGITEINKGDYACEKNDFQV